jgi:peptidoglycan/LPS O-acetylase OafA/YrhL
MNRIPTLDGWRGIAILFVLATHLQISLLLHLWGGFQWMNLGQHGVTLFFVLSGYLITSRLLSEQKIDFGAFYVRRFFRLMPVAWLYLLTLPIAEHLAHRSFMWRDAFACLFFYRNYYPGAHETTFDFRTLQFWSLSLEEQFYLVWPPILALAGKKRAVWVASAGAISCAVFRFFHWAAYSESPIHVRTEVHCDALLVGCIFALLMQSEQSHRIRGWILRYGSPLFWALVPVLLWHIYRYQALIPLTESLTMAVMIVCTSVLPSTLPGKLLEWKHLKFLGVISYSLYLWQESVLYIPLPKLGALLLPFIAILSYGLIERPCTSYGHRLAKKLQRAPAVKPLVVQTEEA